MPATSLSTAPAEVENAPPAIEQLDGSQGVSWPGTSVFADLVKEAVRQLERQGFLKDRISRSEDTEKWLTTIVWERFLHTKDWKAYRQLVGTPFENDYHRFEACSLVGYATEGEVMDVIDEVLEQSVRFSRARRPARFADSLELNDTPTPSSPSLAKLGQDLETYGHSLDNRSLDWSLHTFHAAMERLEKDPTLEAFSLAYSAQSRVFLTLYSQAMPPHAKDESRKGIFVKHTRTTPATLPNAERIEAMQRTTERTLAAAAHVQPGVVNGEYWTVDRIDAACASLRDNAAMLETLSTDGISAVDKVLSERTEKSQATLTR